MMEPAVFRVVDSTGQVHGTRMTSGQASGMMEILLNARPNISVRSERIDLPISEKSEKVTATPIVSETYPVIPTGQEREALRQAIDGHLDASARLDSANQAVERASAFVSARQSELDAMTAAHQSEIEASGANLAEALKAGGAAFETGRMIDRGAVLDAEVRRDTARAALERLAAEQVESDSTYKAAETAVRLVVMAVKRADVVAMVERLEVVKAEFTALATAIDAARFADVPMTIRAQDAIRLDVPGTGAISETAARWHRYSAALRDDADETWEGLQ